MTLQEIKKTAFGKWLLTQPRDEAMLHIWECLCTGPKNNLAWDLLDATQGLKTPLKKISVSAMLDALKNA